MDIGGNNRDIYRMLQAVTERNSVCFILVHKRFPGRNNALVDY